MELLVGTLHFLRVEVLVAFVVGCERFEERSFLLVVVVSPGLPSTPLENLADLVENAARLLHLSQLAAPAFSDFPFIEMNNAVAAVYAQFFDIFCLVPVVPAGHVVPRARELGSGQMAYDAGLVLNDVRIELGEGLDEAFVMLSISGLEIGLLADFPVDLEIANRIEASQYSFILNSTAYNKLD